MSTVAEVFEGENRDFKRRKTDLAKVTNNGTIIGKDGTTTPVLEIKNMDIDQTYEARKKELSFKSRFCPCGFLHGPGQGNHSDMSASGYTSKPLLRGPD
ncbi:uncharacterized protein PRCAT00002900001 [Priceomyces carsonii]|uniref:uncharacterized protein n=1 Tax=Priceomyces carsonii TaxID=28549 RepID=UPI002EDA50D5|nr:unnamed protein product [Priceomyces carsonii]